MASSRERSRSRSPGRQRDDVVRRGYGGSGGGESEGRGTGRDSRAPNAGREVSEAEAQASEMAARRSRLAMLKRMQGNVSSAHPFRLAIK